MTVDESRRHLIEGEKAGERYRLAFDLSRTRGRTGAHLADRSGSSREFHDHREYLPGDDLRHIDWSAYGRSDKLIVKLYREEVSPHLDLLLDGSRSMDLEGTEKGRAALALTALLARAGANAGFSVQVWVAGGGCRKIGGLNDRPSVWQGLEFEAAASPAQALQRSQPPWRPRGVRMLLSDLLWMGNPLEVLQLLSRDASRTAVVQLLARQDSDPDLAGNLRLVDSESDAAHDAFIDSAALSRYRSALARHQDNWRTACRQSGTAMATLIAEDLVDEWKAQDLVAAGILS